jgi:Protein of unknown function (DUF2568)
LEARVKAVALALRFFLELAALVALVVSGVQLVHGLLGWLLGLAALMVAAVAWGLFVAPRARIAIPTAGRLAVEIAVFAVATAGLFATGHPVLASVLGGLYIVDRLALLASGAPAYESNPTGQGRSTPRRS